MVIDSSALVAIAFEEPEAKAFLATIHGSELRLLAAPTLAEASIVIMTRKGEAALARFRVLIAQARIEIIPFDDRLAALAVEAYRRFGKGRHPAALNLGDCFAYALAKSSGLPLLCKGQDFPQTDILLSA